MAGHNKWSKVKHIKGAADAKRSKLFSKLAKEISVAARDGGGDPDLNARLRQAVSNAKNKPKAEKSKAEKTQEQVEGGKQCQELSKTVTKSRLEHATAIDIQIIGIRKNI